MKRALPVKAGVNSAICSSEKNSSSQRSWRVFLAASTKICMFSRLSSSKCASSVSYYPMREDVEGTYRSDNLLAEATVSPEKRVALFSFFSELLPHWFNGSSKLIDLCLSFLFLIEQFITFRGQSVEDILLEADFLRSVVVIIENQSVKFGLRVEVMKRD